MVPSTSVITFNKKLRRFRVRANLFAANTGIVGSILFYVQLIAYAVLAVLGLNAMLTTGIRNTMLSLFASWHTVTLLQYVILASAIRLRYSKTLIGAVWSGCITALAGVAGELYQDAFYIPYHWSDFTPAARMMLLYDATFLALYICAMYAMELQWAFNLRRVAVSIIVVTIGVMLPWILTYNYLWSICLCSYGLQYLKDPVANTYEVGFYTAWFILYYWAMHRPKRYKPFKITSYSC